MKLNIENIMKEKGLNAISLSDKMASIGKPLSRISIGSIINGNSSPRLETLNDIAMALEVPLFDLLDGHIPNEMAPIYRKDDSGNFIEIGYLQKVKINGPS